MFGINETSTEGSSLVTPKLFNRYIRYDKVHGVYFPVAQLVRQSRAENFSFALILWGINIASEKEEKVGRNGKGNEADETGKD
ncbi:hypothetical protein POVCU2_0000750 [Plasmodium ovale curtisi]|uniref:Uncharacterized protein n=1 Tax=Plasmodium ovale curtisi TaxID=864141 RepID=A0A1A8VM94_PLAOA|nr:hypothetical protein POVCU2_0000750 [Plasmodium ovale curtisi]SBS80384.1 hypothetical protein POVCU1_000640 [Plasmodium ovale curtisi]